MSRIRRYNKSRNEGKQLFFKTVGLTLLGLLSLAAGFVSAAYFSGVSIF